MLVNQDTTFGKRDSQMRGFDLKDSSFKCDGVVMAHTAFFFDGEDQIKIDVCFDWDKSGARLLGFDGEAFVELADINFFQKTVGIFHGFDAM